MNRLPAIVLLALCAACSATAGNGEPVLIRIANESGVAFDRVVVTFPGQEEDYGAVTAGGQTSYRHVERAYEYARIEAHRGGEVLVLQPIDYVGESLLTGGRYTYVLDVETAASGSLLFSFRRDE